MVFVAAAAAVARPEVPVLSAELAASLAVGEALALQVRTAGEVMAVWQAAAAVAPLQALDTRVTAVKASLFFSGQKDTDYEIRMD